MTTKHLKVFMVATAILMIVTACDHLPVHRGSGNLVTETRPVSGFTVVQFDGAGEVDIIQDGSESLTIETDDDVMEQVTTEVRDGTLHVSQNPGSPTPTRLKVSLHVNQLTGISIPGKWSVRVRSLKTDILAIRVEGTASLRTESLTAGELTVVIMGSGDMDIAGLATAQTLIINGTGTYHSGDLQSETVSLVVSGSGDLTLWATETLDMKIEGACTVDYYGRPVIHVAQTRACVFHSLGDK